MTRSWYGKLLSPARVLRKSRYGPTFSTKASSEEGKENPAEPLAKPISDKTDITPSGIDSPEIDPTPGGPSSLPPGSSPGGPNVGSGGGPSKGPDKAPDKPTEGEAEGEAEGAAAGSNDGGDAESPPDDKPPLPEGTYAPEDQVFVSHMVHNVKFDAATPEDRWKFIDWLQDNGKGVDKDRGTLLYLAAMRRDAKNTNERIYVDNQINEIVERSRLDLAGVWNRGEEEDPSVYFQNGPFIGGQFTADEIRERIQQYGMGALDWVSRFDFSGDDRQEVRSLLLGDYYRRGPLNGWLERLRTLEFAVSDSGQAFAEDVCRILMHTPHVKGLHRLDFYHNGIGDAGVAALVFSMNVGVFSGLRELVLRGENITDQGVAALLTVEKPRLTVLDLAGNYIDYQGRQALREHFGVHVVGFS